MKNQIDHILLGLLWLLATTLGASFWFTVRFGFNLFSGAHWVHLGQLQVSHVQINSAFYISMIICVIIMISGLYLILRPRFRKIKLCNLPQNPQNTILADNKNADNNSIKNTPSISPQINDLARPPRLVMPMITNPAQITPYPSMHNTPATTNQTDTKLPIITPVPTNDALGELLQEITSIFESTGYQTKQTPKIGSLRTALFAVGSDETLWVGAVGVAPSELSDAIEKLNGIFLETLDDIYINISGFVLNPTVETNDNKSILMFDTISQLRNHMNDNKNNNINESDSDNFTAYSEYIDTVANHLNNGYS